MTSKLPMILAVALLSAAVSGCQKKEGEGPAERAGKQIDQTVEKAGQKIDQAVDKAAQKLEQAGDKVKEKIGAKEKTDDKAKTEK
jgi:hypothetical protein